MKVLKQRKTKNRKYKVSWLFTALILFFFVPVSCDRAPEKVLTQHQMINFLADLHKLDGYLAIQGLTTIDDRENVYLYNALLAKHKISKAQFDSSLVWYTHQPKKFNKIYQKVLLTLNLEDSLIRQQKKLFDDSVARADKKFDIWNKQRHFTLTKDSNINHIDFIISGYEFFTGDIFELIFLHRSSPVDTTFKELAVLRVNYENNITDSLLTNLVTDSLLRRYTLRFRARKSLRVQNISGLISTTDKPKKRIKTVVDSLSLIYSYSPPVHDALRLKWQNESVVADTIAENKPKLPHFPRKNFKKNQDK